LSYITVSVFVTIKIYHKILIYFIEVAIHEDPEVAHFVKDYQLTS